MRRPRTPLLVDRLAEAEELAPPQQREAEHELFREPRDAPEIGRRPLDMGIPHQPVALMHVLLCLYALMHGPMRLYPDSAIGKRY